MSQQHTRKAPIAANLFFRSIQIVQRAERLRDWLGHRWVDRINGNSGRPQTFTHPSELVKLLELAFSAPPATCFLEIGSAHGASARYLGAAAAARGSQLVCVDTWQNEGMPDGVRDTWAEFQAGTPGVASVLRTVRKSSADLLPSDIPGKIGLAFIDGDHSYAFASKDIRSVEPLMDRDGIIVLHDTTTFSGVGRALGELLATKKWQLGGLCRSLSWVRRADWAHDL